MNVVKNLVFLVVIVGLVVTSAAIWWTFNIYDETAATGLSRNVRETLYNYANRREPRIILAPDNEQLADPLTDYENITIDWFTKKTPAWEAALAELKGQPNLQYLEVGAYEGRSVVWMLKNILTHPTSRVTVIDIFYESADPTKYEAYSPELRQRYDANIAQAGATEQVTTLVGFSQNELRGLPLGLYDVIYIDGSHLGTDVLEDAILAQRLLKLGGYLIFDDYRWWAGASNLVRSKNALDIFVEYYGDQFEVLHNQYQMILQKVDRDPVDEGMVDFN